MLDDFDISIDDLDISIDDLDISLDDFDLEMPEIDVFCEEMAQSLQETLSELPETEPVKCSKRGGPRGKEWREFMTAALSDPDIPIATRRAMYDELGRTGKKMFTRP